jgi:hypothetical protein
MLITADAGECVIKIVPWFMLGPRFTLPPYRPTTIRLPEVNRKIFDADILHATQRPATHALVMVG